MGIRSAVCHFWRAGRCSRHPCPFLHSGDPVKYPRSLVWKNPLTVPPRRSTFKASSNTKSIEKVTNLYSSSSISAEKLAKENHVENSFSLLATLQGHKTAVTGVALPSGGSADKLFSGDKVGSLRVWDCNTGQCDAVIDLGGTIGCMISEGPWLFIGIPNVVKAWNSEKKTGLITLLTFPDGQNTTTLLTVPDGQNTTAGQVCALATGPHDLVFAGTHNAHILSWKYTADVLENNYLPAATCINEAHKLPIISLIVSRGKLYSGSVDTTIRIWEITVETGALRSCLRTITGHTEAVTSLICWDHYLLSCSLDKKIKVWGMAETEDNLCEYYTHTEEHDLLLLVGVNGYQLLCSRNDNSLQIFNLPSFEKRDTIFFEGEVSAVCASETVGLFFTGDATGDLKVWKWKTSEEKKPTTN